MLAVSVHLLSGLKDGVNTYVFLLTIHLIKKKRFVVGLLYLGSLFGRLDDCDNNILCSVGHYDMAVHANTCFLQIFIGRVRWHRF